MSNKNPIQHLIELNIQTKYEQLLKVKVLHDFFIDGAAKNIEIYPDSQTKLRLKQYNLKSSQEGSNLVIGFGQTAMVGPAILDLKMPLKLSFWIKVNDPNFLNYTDIPYEFGDYIYHFTNRINDKLEDEYANLSSDEFVGSNDRLPVAGAILDYRLSEPMDNLQVEVINELGEVVFERQYKGSTSVCSLNLSQEPAGKYTLVLDGLEEFSFYLAPEGVKNIFGVIDLYIDPNDNSPFSLFDNGEPIKKKEFKIHFQTRAVKWKYIVMETNPNNPQHSDYEIYDNSQGAEEVEFSDAEDVLMESGIKAIVFWTENPIPFREVQEQKFKLRTLRGKSGVEWITDLASASAKMMLKTEKSSKNDFFSEILVYL